MTGPKLLLAPFATEAEASRPALCMGRTGSKAFRVLLAGVFGLALLASRSEAATYYWVSQAAPDNNWATAANWSAVSGGAGGAGVPGAGDTAVFDGVGANAGHDCNLSGAVAVAVITNAGGYSGALSTANFNLTVGTMTWAAGTFNAGSATLTLTGTGTPFTGGGTINAGSSTFKYAPDGAGSAWLSGFGYRKSHVVSQTAGAGTGYQVQIKACYGSGIDSGGSVYLGSKGRTDFGDVRFTAGDGTTELSYWMESKTDSDNAVFWVKLSADLSAGDQTVYVYYGNSAATTTSSGEATFEFFDDFSTEDNTKFTYGSAYVAWNAVYYAVSGGMLRLYSDNTYRILRMIKDFAPADNVAVRTRFKTSGASTWHHNYLVESGDPSQNRFGLQDPGGGTRDFRVQYYYDGSSSVTATVATLATDTWYLDEIRKKSAQDMQAVIWSDAGTQLGSTSQTRAQWADETWTWVTWQYQNVNVYFDWIAVRKCNSAEPAHGAWGAEASQPADISVSAAFAYNHLIVAPSAGWYAFKLGTAGGQTLTVGGNMTIGDGAVGCFVSAASYNPNISVTGNYTVMAGGAVQASDAGSFAVTGDWANSGLFLAGAGAMQVAGNWSNSGTFLAGTGTVTLNATGGARTVGGSASTTFYNLTKNSAQALTIGDAAAAGKTITVSNTFAWTDNNDTITVGNGQTVTFAVPAVTIAGGCTLASTGVGTISTAGNWTNNGTFTHGNGSVILNGGAAQAIAGSADTSFYNLTKNTAQTLTVGDAASADRTIAVANAFTWTDNNDTIVVGNGQNVTFQVPSITIAGGCTLTSTAAQGTIKVSGDWDNASGTFNRNTGTVVFNGGGAQTIITGGTAAGKTFFNFTVDKTGGTAALAGNITAGGTFRVSQGTLSCTGYVITTTNGYDLVVDGGTLQLGDQQHEIKGGWTYSAGTVTPQTSTVRFWARNSSQSVNTISGTFALNDVIYYSGTGSTNYFEVLDGTLTVNGTLTFTINASWGAYLTGDGSLYAKGNVVGTAGRSLNIDCALFEINGDAGDQTLTDLRLRGYSAVAGRPTVRINKAADSALIAGSCLFQSGGNSGRIYLQADSPLSYAAGSTLTLDSSPGGSYSSTTYVTGGSTIDLYDLTCSLPAVTGNGNINLGGKTLTVHNDLNVTISYSSWGRYLNNGTIDVKGNYALTNSTGGSYALTAAIKLSGSADTTATYSGDITAGFVGFEVAKDAGKKVSLASHFYANMAGADVTVTSGILDLAGWNLTVNDAFSAGASGTLKLYGSETLSAGSTTFDAGSLVWFYGTVGPYAVTDLATAYSDLKIDGAGATFAAGASMSCRNLEIAAGTFSAPAANLSVSGNWTNGATFNHNSGTVIFNGAAAQTITAGGVTAARTFYNIYVDNTHASPDDSNDVDTSGPIKVDGLLTVNDGQFQPETGSDLSSVAINANGILKPDASATVTVSGNWSNSGTFTANGGTVDLDSTGAATLAGSTTFYNLSCTVSTGKLITLTAGTTQTVSSTLTLTGGGTASQILLRSTASGSRWTFNFPNGTQSVNFVDVQDGECSGNDATDVDGTNRGGNDDGDASPHWVFTSTGTGLYWSGPSGGGDGNWNVADCWGRTPGAHDGSVPTADDEVYFGSTATNKCTVNVGTARCKSIDFTSGTGYTGTFDLNGNTLEVSWTRLKLYSGMTFTPSAGLVDLIATAGTVDVTTAGKSLYDLRCGNSGAGADYELQDNLTCTNDLTVTAGTLAVGVRTATVGGATSGSGQITIGTGKVDANGHYGMGATTFTDAGQLDLAGASNSLGTSTRPTR
mgnify:FL=1